MATAPSFKSAMRENPGLGEAGQQRMANQLQSGFMRDTVGTASAPGTARLLGNRIDAMTSEPRLDLQRGRLNAEAQQQMNPMAALRQSALMRQGGSGFATAPLREGMGGLSSALGTGYARTRLEANEGQNKLRLGMGKSGLGLQGLAGQSYSDLGSDELSAQQNALEIAKLNAERQTASQSGLMQAGSSIFGGLTQAGLKTITAGGGLKDFGSNVATGFGGGLKK